MTDQSRVSRFAEQAKQFMIHNPRVELRGEIHSVSIQQAVEYVVTTEYVLEPGVVNFGTWTQRLYLLGLAEPIEGSTHVWVTVIFAGGETYHDHFVNYVRALTAAAVVHELETNPRYAELVILGQQRHAARDKLIAQGNWSTSNAFR